MVLFHPVGATPRGPTDNDSEVDPRWRGRERLWLWHRLHHRALSRRGNHLVIGGNRAPARLDAPRRLADRNFDPTLGSRGRKARSRSISNFILLWRVPFRGCPSPSPGNPSSTLSLPDYIAGTVQIQLIPAARTGILSFVFTLCERDSSITCRTQVAGARACRDLILDPQRQSTIIDPLCDLLSQYALGWF